MDEACLLTSWLAGWPSSGGATDLPWRACLVEVDVSSKLPRDGQTWFFPVFGATAVMGDGEERGRKRGPREATWEKVTGLGPD